MSRPVLIVGARGLVGRALLSSGEAEGFDGGEVVALSRQELDVTDHEGQRRILAELRPRIVINCSVFQPVDRCETEPLEAFEVNAIAAGALAEACRRVQARCVHLSTDYVFGGDRRVPYKEEDPPRPLSVYAASKLAGEHLVLAASELHMVVRTAAVFGVRGEGHGTAPFLERMLERALAREPTRVVADQVVSPTAASDLAGSVWALLRAGGTGVFHVTNSGEASWFDIAKVAFAAVGARDSLRPTTSREYGAPARRPPYSALASQRLADLGVAALPPWRDAVERFLAETHPDLAV